MKNNDFNQKWLKAFGNRLTAEQSLFKGCGIEKDTHEEVFVGSFPECLDAHKQQKGACI